MDAMDKSDNYQKQLNLYETELQTTCELSHLTVCYSFVVVNYLSRISQIFHTF